MYSKQLHFLIYFLLRLLRIYLSQRLVRCSSMILAKFKHIFTIQSLIISNIIIYMYSCAWSIQPLVIGQRIHTCNLYMYMLTRINLIFVLEEKNCFIEIILFFLLFCVSLKKTDRRFICFVILYMDFIQILRKSISIY